MTIRKHANLISTTLNGGITLSATTIVLNSATGLPAISPGETFNLTITDGTNTEIVTITDDASTPSFTVIRGAEGTTAVAFVSGDIVELRPTADSFDRKQDQIATAGESINFGLADDFEIPNSATPVVDTDGQIAIDTTVTDFSHGVLKYYGGEEMGVISMPISQFTSPTDDHVVTYNSTSDEFELQAGIGKVVQQVNTQTGAVATTTTVMPLDDTIPQNTEGGEFMTLAITPVDSLNILRIQVTFVVASSAVAHIIGALFQDTTAGALNAVVGVSAGANNISTITLTHSMIAGTTSSTTFKFRAGSAGSGTLTFNGQSGSRLFGGTMGSSITITEYLT